MKCLAVVLKVSTFIPEVYDFLDSKLQNEIDDQKVELELNVELEEKMNALHREYSVLQKKYQRKVEDYDGMKEMSLELQ